MLTNECLARLYLAGKDIHARRTDEMPDERMARALEQFYRRADLHDQTIFHDHHLFRKGQRFRLVMSDIDHGSACSMMKLLELRSKLPL